MLDANAQLQQSSPALDTGTARFEWNGEIVLDLPSSAFSGTGPDLGAHEANSLEAHTILFEILREQIARTSFIPSD